MKGYRKMTTKNYRFNSKTFNFNEILETIISEPSTVSQCYELFHDFSIYNQMLAIIQLKHKGLKITPVACGSRWRKLGREIIVKKSEALALCLPIYYWANKKDINGNIEFDANGKPIKIKILSHFEYPQNWYSLEQTKGDTINPHTLKIVNFNFDKIYKKHDIEIVDYDSLNGNCQGYAKVSGKKLAINPIAEHPEMTLLHEISHILLNHDTANYDRSIKEVEAEACAYLVGVILKLPENQLADARGYIKGWLGEGNKIPETNIQNIFRITKEILDTGCEKQID